MTNYRIPTNAGEKTNSPRDSAVLVLTNKRTIQHNSFKYGGLRKQIERKEKGLPLLTPKKTPRPYRKLSKPPNICGAIKSIFIETDANGIGVIHKKGLPCNQWGCPRCGPRKVIQVRKLLIEIIRLNKLDRFLTLTLSLSQIPKEYLTPINRTGKYISEMWNRFILTMKRRIKKPIKFVWIKQFQKNGDAHLHLMINRFLPKYLLVYHWNRIHAGYIIDIQRAKNLEASAVYISRYLSMGIQDNGNGVSGFLVGERRYGISRNCIRTEKPPKEIHHVHNPNSFNSPLSIAKFFDLLDILQNPDKPDGDYYIQPHQETITSLLEKQKYSDRISSSAALSVKGRVSLRNVTVVPPLIDTERIMRSRKDQEDPSDRRRVAPAAEE